MAGSRQKVDGRSSEIRGTARARLVEAAERVVAEHCYHATTVEEVVREAGISRGALYWHYENKHELFLGVLEERFDSHARGLLALITGVGDAVDDDRQVVLLMNELWALAARDDDVRERWVDRRTRLRAKLSQALNERQGAEEVTLAEDLGHFAAAILAMADGLAMDRVTEPETTNPALLGEVLDLLQDGLAFRAQQAASRES